MSRLTAELRIFIPTFKKVYGTIACLALTGQSLVAHSLLMMAVKVTVEGGWPWSGALYPQRIAPPAPATRIACLPHFPPLITPEFFRRSRSFRSS